MVHHTSTTPYGRDLGRRADDGQGFSDNAYPSSRSGEGYTCHVNDRQLELTYMRARFYDPVLGRFLSNDPVGFTSENPTSFNRYAYANNSPYTYVDPDGRQAYDIIDPLSVTPSSAMRHQRIDVVGLNPGFDSGALVGSALGVGLWALANSMNNDSDADSDPTESGDGSDDTQEPRTRKVTPDSEAQGPHTTWKTDPVTGKITRHETWTPNPQNPSGWDTEQSTDLQGAPHVNKQTGTAVPTPHTQGSGIPWGVRPATPGEIPNSNTNR